MVDPKSGERWLLVTSAHHMPRAIGIFRAAGFPVEAYPVDWRTRGAVDLMQPFTTLGDGLRRTDTAAREWVGLLAYWVTGRIVGAAAGSLNFSAASCRVCRRQEYSGKVPPSGRFEIRVACSDGHEAWGR